MSEISIYNIGQIIGTHIAKKVNKPEKANQLSYGAELLIGGAVKTTILLVASIILGIVTEVILLVLVVAGMRALSGGAHCTAYYRCLIASVIIFVSIGYAIKIIYPLLSILSPAVLGGIIFLYIYLYWCYGPQAPVNKPFQNEAVEAAFRRHTLMAVLILSLVSIMLGVKSLISWIIVIGLLWQAFTLTNSGHKCIKFIDDLLDYEKDGGEKNV